MTEEDLRDCFAMFALTGLVMMNKEPYDDEAVAELSYTLADAMLKARKKDEGEELGIAAIKPRRRYNRKGA
jgi:hypothetical protein